MKKFLFLFLILVVLFSFSVSSSVNSCAEFIKFLRNNGLLDPMTTALVKGLKSAAISLCQKKLPSAICEEFISKCF